MKNNLKRHTKASKTDPKNPKIIPVKDPNRGGLPLIVRTYVCVQGDFLKRFRKSPALCGASFKCLVLRF